jgi:hypothetical protein
LPLPTTTTATATTATAAATTCPSPEDGHPLRGVRHPGSHDWDAECAYGGVGEGCLGVYVICK